MNTALNQTFRLFALLVLLFASTAKAELLDGAGTLAGVTTQILELRVSARNGGILANEKGRDGLIGIVQRYCREIDRSVPKNSPAEIQWLQGELSSGNESRIRSGILSKEFARNQMADLLRGCLLWVEVYQEEGRDHVGYRVVKTSALIQLGRVFGGNGPHAWDVFDKLGIEALRTHAALVTDIMDLFLIAAYHAILE